MARPGLGSSSQLWHAICNAFSIRVILTENAFVVFLHVLDAVQMMCVGGSVVKKCMTFRVADRSLRWHSVTLP